MDKETLANVAGIVGVVIVLVLVALIAWAVLRGREWLLKKATQNLEKLLSQLDASTKQREGSVKIRFPVYVGTVVTITELTSEVWVPSPNARETINALALFSLKFGLLTILAPYVLFMVFLNYVLHLPKLLAN